MQKKLKILFIPLAAVGHVNSAIGMAQVLIKCGHEVIFFITDQWKNKLVKYGIQEILYPETYDENAEGKEPGAYWAELCKKLGILSDNTALQKMINMGKDFDKMMNRIIDLDERTEKIIKEVNPDVMVCDQVQSLPAVEKSGIPWVLVCSCNPLFGIEDERTPPGGSGLPAIGSEKEWKEFRRLHMEGKVDVCRQLNDYLKKRGVEQLRAPPQLINDSKYLNIYPLPRELDYTDLRPLPKNWVQFDNFMRVDEHNHKKFEIPEQLRHKPGKLIFLSMGSMGSADVDLMKRLVGILSESKHRFIVSKGPLHDKYSLSANMWGQQSVPQIQVLSAVDLFITHGGNNSLTEAFFYGKPLIVMPLFVDQYDNAQRVHEKGFGLRLDPYRCTSEELLNGIESLLSDRVLNENLKNISKRIQTENSIAKLTKLLEDLVY